MVKTKKRKSRRARRMGQPQCGGNIFTSIGRALTKPSTYLGLASIPAGVFNPAAGIGLSAASKGLAMTGNGRRLPKIKIPKIKPSQLLGVAAIPAGYYNPNYGNVLKSGAAGLKLIGYGGKKQYIQPKVIRM